MKIAVAKTNRLGNRHNNQDRLDMLERDQAVLLVLADGMGGYKGGELAAETAVKKVLEYFRISRLPIADPKKFFENAFLYAHKSVIETGMKQKKPIKPRTTLVACLVQEGKAWSAHIGDSRFYLFRNGGILQRSRDHSTVEEMLQSGQISEREARSHPMLNRVSRCIGGHQASVDVEVSDNVELQANDVILLCSDGLWGALEDHHINEIVAANRRLDIATQVMAEQAESASYPKSDNISILTMRWISNERSQKQAQDCETANAGKGDSEVNEAIDEINEALKKVVTDIKYLA